MDNFTGKNKGFAYVEFEERADAEEFKRACDGYEADGRRIRLDWDVSKPKERSNFSDGPKDGGACM